MRTFVSKRGRDSVLRWTAGILLLSVAGYLLARRYAPFLADPAWLRAFVLGFGPWAPFVFVGLQAGQVIAAPVPGQAVGVVGGYLFGAVWGTIYSVVGTTLGSAVAFSLSRRYGRGYVERVLAPETLARFDALAERDAAGALLIAFLVPGLPDDAICFVGGLTDLSLWKLVAIAGVGRTPGFALAAAAGAGLATGHLDLALALLGTLAAASLVGFLLRDRVAAFLARRARQSGESGDSS